MKPTKKTDSSKSPATILDDASETVAPVGERIAKRMARAGLCSRRDAERWIADGRVKVNGKTLQTPACVVTAKDHILVDEKDIPVTERTRLWLLNKRSGLVTTSNDPEGRKTVFEVLPEDLPRVMSVGRLDINTEGLLLLTNDGGLSRALELPSTGWLRRYRVRAHGTITQPELDTLKDGIAVDGVLYGSIEAELERQQGSNVWLTFAMREGKNREVKKVLAALSLDVNRLIRTSYGPFQLGDLRPGEVQEVRGRTLRDQLGSKLIAQSGANFDAPLLATLPKALKKPTQAAKAEKAAKRGKKVDPLSRLDTKPQKPERNGRSKNAKGGQRGAAQKGQGHADRRR